MIKLEFYDGGMLSAFTFSNALANEFHAQLTLLVFIDTRRWKRFLQQVSGDVLISFADPASTGRGARFPFDRSHRERRKPFGCDALLFIKKHVAAQPVINTRHHGCWIVRILAFT